MTIPSLGGDQTPEAAVKAAAVVTISTFVAQEFDSLLDRGIELGTAVAVTSFLALVITVITYVIISAASSDSGSGSALPRSA